MRIPVLVILNQAMDKIGTILAAVLKINLIDCLVGIERDGYVLSDINLLLDDK